MKVINAIIALLFMCFTVSCSQIQIQTQAYDQKQVIYSLMAQGQFDEAAAASEKYISSLKGKNYPDYLYFHLYLHLSLEFLTLQGIIFYRAGNYEKVISGYDKIDNAYQQILHYRGRKPGDERFIDTRNAWWECLYGYYNFLCIDSLIQLGEYENALAGLDKIEKTYLSKRDKLDPALLAQLKESSRYSESKLTASIINFQRFNGMRYKILALNALDQKSESLELWNQFKLEYPVYHKPTAEFINFARALHYYYMSIIAFQYMLPQEMTEEYINKAKILQVYYMLKNAWLVDDGDFLLKGGRLINDTHIFDHYPKNHSIANMQKDTIILEGLFYEAEGLRLTGKNTQAVNVYQNYLSKLGVEGQNRTLLWKAYGGLGKAYEALDEKEKASEAYLEAINVIENERKFLSKDSYKQNFLLHRNHPYDRAVILLAERDPEKSFFIAEQGKSRALLDLLEGKIVGRTPQARETNEIISKEGRKLQASSTLATTSPDRISPPPLQTTRASIKQAKSELERTDIELLSLINAQAETYADFSSLMTSDTAIIEYYFTPEEGVIFVGVGENLDAIKILLKEEDIRGMVRLFVDEIISGKKESELHKVGNNIFNEILAPALNQIERDKKPIARLLIVPHGSLHFLPFSALSDGKKWLIEKYEIAQLPSASVLKFCRDKSAHEYQNILAFGNPSIIGDIPELPAAQLEVETIGKLFSQQAKIVMREDAKETIFRSEGPNYNIIHFACHAEFDSTSPSRSALLLSADDQNDGRLEVWEIMQTPLEASFVAMSACNTSLGSISSGDEVVGLSRGMLYAGTPSLLGSLWSIDDKATSILMASFYKGLQKGAKPTSALREAQLEMLKLKDKSSVKRSVKIVDKEKQVSFTTNYSHPFFWAAFNIIGDWQ